MPVLRCCSIHIGDRADFAFACITVIAGITRPLKPPGHCHTMCRDVLRTVNNDNNIVVTIIFWMCRYLQCQGAQKYQFVWRCI